MSNKDDQFRLQVKKKSIRLLPFLAQLYQHPICIFGV